MSSKNETISPRQPAERHSQVGQSMTSTKASSEASSKAKQERDKCFSNGQIKTPHVETKEASNCGSRWYCPNFFPDDNTSESMFNELRDQMHGLALKLSDCRTENQLLKNQIHVAKKVVKREVGGNSVSFECLLRRANEEGWMGRQETILALKRKLHDLRNVIARMDGQPLTLSPFRVKKKRDISPEDIPDERKVYWRLQIERRDILRNAERDKKALIRDRDIMKKKLDSLLNRNEQLTEEMQNVREELSKTQIRIDDEIETRLWKLKNRMRMCLENKSSQSRMLDEVQRSICSNMKEAIELREEVAMQKQIVKDKQAILSSLKGNEATLQCLNDQVNCDKAKGALRMKKKLAEIELDYQKIVARLESMAKALVNSKHIVERLNADNARQRIGAGDNIVKAIKETVSKDTTTETSDGQASPSKESSDTYLQSEASAVQQPEENTSDLQPEPTVASEPDEETSQCKIMKATCEKYITLFETLEEQNCDRAEQIYEMIDRMKEDVHKQLRDRYKLLKVFIETEILKQRISNLRKACETAIKPKSGKKKEEKKVSCEVIEERKMMLVILKKECKFLKTLIRYIISSKEDDFQLCGTYLYKNKELFVNAI